MESKKEHILMTAFLLFLKNGYKAVSISDIVKQSGVTKGGIYHHFTGKEDLFTQVLRQYFTPSLEKLLKDLSEIQGAPKEKLHSFFRVYESAFNEVSGYKEIPDLEFGIYFLMIEGTKYIPGFSDELSAVYGRIIAAAESIITEGIQSGDFRKDEDTSLTARSLVSLAEGGYLIWLLNREVPLSDVLLSARRNAERALLRK